VWSYGATQFEWLESQGMRAGGRVAGRGERVPVGEVHAIDEHRDAACGVVGAEPVFAETVEWGSRSFLTHCAACTNVVGR
jgi:hypothetical protein